MDMASSLVHHPGLGTTFSSGSELSGLEGLVNAATGGSTDPSVQAAINHHHYGYHTHPHHTHTHPHSHGGHHGVHHGYNQHLPPPPPMQQRVAYFNQTMEDVASSSSTSLLGLGGLTSQNNSGSNESSYSPNSTTNNLPTSTVKIKSGKLQKFKLTFAINLLFWFL
jgi:hypothetical protein